MKKLILAATLIIVAFVSYNFTFKAEKNVFPEDLSTEYINLFDAEYIKTIDNEDLKAQLKTDFSSLFDEIYSVRAQYSDKNDYYYIVIGTQEGVDKIELLKVSESDVKNDSYTYIDFSNFDTSKTMLYCRSGVNTGNPRKICPSACQNYSYPCLGMTCGIYVPGIGCI